MFCHMDKKMISPPLNGVLETILVCLQLFIKTIKCYLMFMVYHSFLDFWETKVYFHALCPN